MDEDSDTGGAELAFEALRAEVAALRQAVEGQTAPDYALTLGVIAKELQDVGARLTAMEGHPAMAMTPEGYSGQLIAAAERAYEAGGKAIWDVQTQLGTAARQLERSAGNIRTREEQQRWIGTAVAGGVLLGIALWYILPSLLPWGAGDWLASSLIGGGRWRAGETLMERANPESFGRMVRLYNACGQQPVESCEAAITARTAATQPSETSTEKASAGRPPQSRTGR